MPQYLRQFRAPPAQPPETQTNDGLQTILTFPRALSPGQCEQLIERGEREPLASGRVNRGASIFRDCGIAWLSPGDENPWLFEVVESLFERASQSFSIGVQGLHDPLQYTLYGTKQHYDWHMDIGPGPASARKLSLSINLSDPNDYLGGALEFAHAPGWRGDRAQGSAIVFPSFMSHRVTPVFRGARRSLVAWACGTPFR
jgi:PKHD-type hydroxylase